MKCKRLGAWEDLFKIVNSHWRCFQHNKRYCGDCRKKTVKGIHITAYELSGQYYCNHCSYIPEKCNCEI